MGIASHIAMKQSHRSFDDLNIRHNPTLRGELEAALKTAEGMTKQRMWSERIADSGELLMLEYKEQLRIIENITEEAREAFIEVSLSPNTRSV